MKGDLLCQEVMVQAQLVKDQVQVGAKAWVVVRVEAEWAVHLPPVPAAIVSARVVDTGHRTWRASRAIRRAVPSAAAL